MNLITSGWSCRTPTAYPWPLAKVASTFEIEGTLEVGRPAGHPRGVPFNVPLAFNFAPLPLPPGGRYIWAFYLDTDAAPSGTVGFNTRPQP